MLIILILLIPLITAQLALPIISDPKYHLISGETLIQSQLSSWNIQLGPLDLDLNLENGTDLETGISTRSSCKRSLRSCRDLRHTEEEVKRALGLPFLGKVSLGASVSIGVDSGWGKAENVAREERGDTEVTIDLSSHLSCG